MVSVWPSDAAPTGVKVERSDEQQQHTTMAIPQSTPISIASTAAPSPPSTEETALNMTGTSASASTMDSDIEMQNGDRNDPPVDALEHVGSSSRILIEGIQRLQVLGIDASLPSLPKFVVIGDQSAGKSSIIEATCDITLPRSEGTCTRCPYQITASTQRNPAESWVCSVSLLYPYSYNKNHVAGKHGAEFDHFKSAGDTTSIPFAVIRSKTELEATLKRAQLAVLNPDKDPNIFRDPAVIMTGKNTVGFSPNVISLKIEAPGLPELSLYDLPGAINSMGREDEQYLVDFVEKLLELYVKDEKALILLACAANQDVETSTALRLLRKWRATARAMGVLTKPDLIEMTPARHDHLQRMLQGKDFNLAGGWFITKQLSQKELDQATRSSYEHARSQEATFFSQAPWSTDLAGYTSRFGIPKLQRAISEKLTNHILANLPSIVARVQARIDDVKEMLSQFPEKDPAPTLVVHIEYTKVQDAIQKQLAADGKLKFRADYRGMMFAFRDKVKSLRPEIDLHTPGYERPILGLDTEDEVETPSKKRRTNQGREPATPSRAFAGTPTSRRREKSRVPQSRKSSFNLGDAKEKFDTASSGFVGQSNPEVSKIYAIEALKQSIPETTSAILNRVEELVSDMLLTVIGDVLAPRRCTELFAQTMKIAQELLQDVMKETKTFIRRLVLAELSRPITYSDEVSRKIKSTEDDLRKRRAAIRTREHFGALECEGRKVPSFPEQDKKSVDLEWVESTLGVDTYDREVSGLALPLAYYDMATTAFVDLIAKQLEFGIITRYQADLPTALSDCLKVTDADYCTQLLAEDPQRERDRLVLLSEQSRLEEALQELHA